MDIILTAEFSFEDLYALQSHKLQCWPLSIEEARDRLQFGFLSIAKTEETAKRLSDLLGVQVPVGEGQLEIKTSGRVVVAQAITRKPSQGFQFWFVVFLTTYNDCSALPKPYPRVYEGWCLSCGY